MATTSSSATKQSKLLRTSLVVGIVATACGRGLPVATNDAGSNTGADAPVLLDSTPGPVICIPGELRLCACPNGGNGAQVCSPSGMALGPCQGCMTMDTDAGNFPGSDVIALDIPPITRVCIPGESRLCACPNGGNGAQVCNPSGTALGPCQGCASPVDAGTVESPCTPNANGSPQSFDYVIHQYLVDGVQTATSTAQPVFGFDLDGVRSPTTRPPEGPPHCAHGDFTSALDTDQNRDANGRPCLPGSAGCNGGVDNQLPTLFDTFSNFGEYDGARQLNESFRVGQGIIVLRISDVNGAPVPGLCDPSVTVRIYRVFPLFSNCSLIASPSASYAIASSSLFNPSDPLSARITLPAAIVDGDLRVQRSPTMAATPSFPFRFPLPGGSSALIDLYNAQIRLSFAVDGSTDLGNLGGVLYKRDFVAALARDPATAPFAAAAAPLLDGFVDIATPLGTPNALCTGRGASGLEEGGIAIGLGFRAAPTRLLDRVQNVPDRGTCGNP